MVIDGMDEEGNVIAVETETGKNEIENWNKNQFQKAAFERVEENEWGLATYCERGALQILCSSCSRTMTLRKMNYFNHNITFSKITLVQKSDAEAVDIRII